MGKSNKNASSNAGSDQFTDRAETNAASRRWEARSSLCASRLRLGKPAYALRDSVLASRRRESDGGGLRLVASEILKCEERV